MSVYYAFFFAILTISLPLRGLGATQIHDRDSLLRSIEEIDSDNNRLKAIQALFSTPNRLPPFSRILLAQHGALIAQAGSDHEPEYFFLNQIAEAWEEIGNRIKAEDSQLRILMFLETHPDTLRKMRAYRRLGENNRARGEYSRALLYLKKAGELARNVQDSLQTGLVLNRIAAVYFEMLIKFSVEHTTDGHRSPEFDKDAGIPIHKIYLDSTIIPAKQSLALGRRSGNRFLVLSNLSILGALYTMLNHFPEADSCFREGLRLSRESGAVENLIELLRNAAELHSKRGNNALALAFIKEADSLSLPLQNPHYQEDTALRLSQLYLKMGMAREAYRELEHAYALRVRIHQDNTQNQIQNATVEAELKHNEAQLQFEKQKRLFIIITFAGVIFTILLVSLLLYRMHRQQKDINRKLQEKNQTILEQKEELERVNAGKDKLFSVIAHDLKSPVWSALTYAEMLAEDYGSFTEGERRAALIHLSNSLQGISGLLQNLLAWAALQLNRTTITPVAASPAAVAETALATFTQQLHNKTITVVNRIPDTLVTYADTTSLYIVLHNLIGNAVKFTPAGGTITLGAAGNNNSMATVWVSNTGTGVPEETAAEIFGDKAVNSSHGTSGERGTGLGLLLCKDMLSANRGSIWLENNPGISATFCFTLPVPQGAVD